MHSFLESSHKLANMKRTQIRHQENVKEIINCTIKKSLKIDMSINITSLMV